MSEEFIKKIENLKTARNNLLSFHKVLIDREKQEIERASGTVTPGQFLNLLMTDEKFEWLRTISRLVVKMDEAFELSDGMPLEKLEAFESEIVAMFDDTEDQMEFKQLVEERLQRLPEAAKIKTEIIRIFE